MKRLLFIVLVGSLLLVACGADSIPQDGLSNAVSLGWDEGVAAVFLDQESITVDKVDIQCAGIFVQDENRAHITYRITTENAALNANGPLFGAGLLVLGDGNTLFSKSQPFTCEGSGQLRAYQTNPEGQAALVDWLLELKASSLTAQIDGVMRSLDDVSMVGVATAGGGELTILTNNENIAVEPTTWQCRGKTIPNSSQAIITFTAETADGQAFGGGGILETGENMAGDDSTEFQCSLQEPGKMSVVYEPNPDNYMLGLTFRLVNISMPTLQMENSNGQQIMFETFMTGTVLGFNVGMPPN